MSDKALEIQRSVCALSSTRGGRLLLGVSKEAKVGGLRRAVLKTYGGDVDDACAGYINGIQEFLRETLKDNQCFRMDRVDVLAARSSL